jgi:hypothetical protein
VGIVQWGKLIPWQSSHKTRNGRYDLVFRSFDLVAGDFLFMRKYIPSALTARRWSRIRPRHGMTVVPSANDLPSLQGFLFSILDFLQKYPSK